MRPRIRKILVTGAAGFIGSAFTRLAVKNDCKVIAVDKLTYAGDLTRLSSLSGRYVFYKCDICDRKKIEKIIGKEKPQAIINFAAETHVDRSIRDARVFSETNLLGTQVLMDVSRKAGLDKFVHISTDEVYGDIIKGRFSEDSPLRPNSPYAASKAAADLMIRAYVRTYGLPAVIARPSNNYGPWQYPEKLIPLAILKILRNEKVPVYAKGKNIREWLYVDDCATGLWQVFVRSKAGQIYNLGSSQETENIEVVKTILKILKKPVRMIKFIEDRPGHDIRYSLDSRKLRDETGWQPKVGFKEGLAKTVDWYLRHKSWLLGKWYSIRPLYR